ncbi:hypothetical protein, variant [Aphanomyces invadans]|uniref:Exocyst subunit Exo70 family protein n=1 Tax=Aphanomyces invadans TaxID=157072 RepID=A0A024UTU9_9STRA|nr:hypothetical protein, variant [Aphanomyces invadans]ETW09352.1 hypothetical protein, variant [Aphanomyces invadans]|eukprot:XP_008863157.1 hypothetical protein, variant [Aphanomyces invadans]
MVEGGAPTAVESDPIARIRLALMDSKAQLSNVNTVLARFKTGLDRLEGQMMPIYNLTEKLRETQKNIDLSVHELRVVHEMFATATEVAPTLHQGAKYDQDEYVKAMQRLLQSISFMESHRGYEGCGKALEHARQVLSHAQVKCKADIVNDIGLFGRYSTVALTKVSDPAEPDESGAAGERQQYTVTASHPSDADVTKVNSLIQCLLGTGYAPRQLLLEYGEKRLKHIKDFFKDKAKVTAEGDMSTAQDSKESIGRYLDSLVFVIKTEKALSSKLFPNEDLSHAALSCTIAPLLETLTNDVNGRRSPPSWPPQHPHKDEVFRPLDLHYLFKDKSAAFKEALQPPLRLREHPGVETADPWKLVGLIGKMEEGLAVTSKQTLAQFKHDIGESLAQDKVGLRDGNVHPVSSNVMQFLRHLCDHVVELECLLKLDQTTNVAYFIDSIVMKLLDSIQAKAHATKGGRDDLRALFTLNNVVYVSQSLKQLGGDVQTVVTAALQQTIQPKVAALGDKALHEFLQLRWRRCLVE